MEQFPDRPVSAIYRRAHTLRIKKIKEDRDNGKLDFADDLSLVDPAVMEQYGLCWKPQEDKNPNSTGGKHGGEHGVFFVCSSGPYG